MLVYVAGVVKTPSPLSMRTCDAGAAGSNWQPPGRDGRRLEIADDDALG